MKTRSQFRMLLLNALWPQHAGEVFAVCGAVLYWACAAALPWVLLFGNKISHGNIDTLFDSGVLLVLGSMVLGMAGIYVPLAIVPTFNSILVQFASLRSTPGATWDEGKLEFLFTRAIERRVLFRMRTALFFTVALAPFFVNILLSPFAHEVRFQLKNPEFKHQLFSAELQTRYERYQIAFPSARGGTIPHGAVTYTAWLAYDLMLVVVLMQAYNTLIAPLVKPNRWWTIVYPVAPVLAFFAIMFGAQTDALWSLIRNYSENNFLFFAKHPLTMVAGLVVLAAAVQVWSEKRFSKLEIL